MAHPWTHTAWFRPAHAAPWTKLAAGHTETEALNAAVDRLTAQEREDGELSVLPHGRQPPGEIAETPKRRRATKPTAAAAPATPAPPAEPPLQPRPLPPAEPGDRPAPPREESRLQRRLARLARRTVHTVNALAATLEAVRAGQDQLARQREETLLESACDLAESLARLFELSLPRNYLPPAGTGAGEPDHLSG